ncbi:MAG: DUF3857 domain-containing protein [Candidatus Eisenbacteria bacterium]|nr:DUF3857 domain-containing protein [Candidatus Eisenbacteria bacterium]
MIRPASRKSGRIRRRPVLGHLGVPATTTERRLPLPKATVRSAIACGTHRRSVVRTGLMPGAGPASILLLALVLLMASPIAALARTDGADLPPGERPPPTAFSRLEEAGTADAHDGADHLIIHQASVTRVKPTGVAVGEEYVLYKVLTPAGARNLAVQTWRYEPWSSMIQVREANILRDGERIPVDVNGVRDLPAPQYGIYWNARLMTLQLPRLLVGDGIELRVYRKGYSYALLENEEPAGRAAPGGGGTGADLANGLAGETTFEPETGDEKFIPPMPGEYFDIILFEADVPILEKRYTLIMPAEKRLHSEIYNAPLYANTTYNADETHYSWWALDMPARPREARRAALSDVAAKVVVATVESWEAKSRWFFDANRKQFEVTPEIQAKVDELLREAGVTDGTEAEKGEVLVHWVAQNIRYSGQTMGEGEGFTLHPGAMIFEQRSGVCKDIAGMLITMMRAAGMDSYAAMTMAGSRIEDVPADQFNHCVCALRFADGSFEMYDPTWVPYMNDIWSKYESEQQYLIGTPEGAPLASIPYSPPEESPLRMTHEAVLAEDGTLTGTIELRGEGVMDSRLRGMVGMRRMQDVGRDIAALLAHFSPAVRGVGFEHPARDDFSQAMWVRIRYEAPEFALPVGGGLEFRSPMMAMTMNDGWLFRAGTTNWEEERTSDVFFYFTQLIEGSERIRLPAGYTAVATPASDTVDETYAYFLGSSEMDGRDLLVKQHTEVRRRQIPPDGFADLRRAIEEAREWEDVLYRVATEEKSEEGSVR